MSFSIGPNLKFSNLAQITNQVHIQSNGGNIIISIVRNILMFMYFGVNLFQTVIAPYSERKCLPQT